MTELDSNLPSHTASDGELIAEVRSGSTQAFGELYARHADAARAVARQYVPSASDADDVVADAFERVLGAIRGGNGPDLAFRAYLFTVVRRLAFQAANGARRTEPTDDDRVFEGAIGPLASVEEPSLRGFESTAVARAFLSLPERWRSVLWYTDIEGARPAQVAPLLGLSANGVAALAYRAREGLRQAYLQEHLNDTVSPECRATNGLLGGYVRGGLSRRETAKVDAHLEDCAACRAVVLELGDVAQSMRGVVAPLVLGLAGMGALAGGLPLWGGLVGAGAVAAGPGAPGPASSSDGAGAGSGAAAGVGVLASAAAASGGRSGRRAGLVGAAAVGVVAVGVAVAFALGVFDSGPRDANVLAEPPAGEATAAPESGADGADGSASPDGDSSGAADEGAGGDFDAESLLPEDWVPGSGAGAAGGSAGNPGADANGSVAAEGSDPSQDAGPSSGTGGSAGGPGGSGGSTPTNPGDPTGPAEPPGPPDPTDPVAQSARASDISVTVPEGQTISASGDTDLDVTVTNSSDRPAHDVAVSIELPEWMSAQAASGGALGRAAARLFVPSLPFEVEDEDGGVAWTCVVDVGLAECAAESLPPQAASTLTLPVWVDVDETDNTTYGLPTTVRVGDEEETSSLEVAVEAYAEVTATVQEHPALVLGQDGELTLEVSNTGQRPASEAWLTVELPEGLVWPSPERLDLRDGSTAGWECEIEDPRRVGGAKALCSVQDLQRSADRLGTVDELRLPVRATAELGGRLRLDSSAQMGRPWMSEPEVDAPVRVSLSAPEVTTLVAGEGGSHVLSFALSNGSSRDLGATTVTLELPPGLVATRSQAVGTARNAPPCAPAVEGGGNVADASSVVCSLQSLAAGDVISVDVELDLPTTQAMGTYPVTATVVGYVPTGAEQARTVELTLAEAAVDLRVDLPNFAWQWQASGHYSVTEVGAPLLYCDVDSVCPNGAPSAGNMQNNNSGDVRLVPLQDDPRGDPDQRNPVSSVTELGMPPGSTVAFAGLYWSAGYDTARYPSGIPAGEDTTTAWLRGPGAEYLRADGEELYPHIRLGSASFYHSFADVTTTVREYGAGQWALADVAHPGGGPGLDQMMAGWALVVVYEDDEAPSSEVTVYDGAVALSGTARVQIALQGSAGDAARIGVVAWEGDRGNTGDTVRLNPSADWPDEAWQSDPTLLEPLHPTGRPSATNAFDSTAFGFRFPNSYGVDAKPFERVDLRGGANVVEFNTRGDAYIVGALTLQTFGGAADAD